MPSEPGDEGRDPLDYRFSLANERTFLAWVRTSLALLAGGIALEEIATSFLSDTARTALAVARGRPQPRARGEQLVAVGAGPGT